MFGREPRLPVDLMYGTPPTDTPSPSHYVTELRSLLSSAYQGVRKNMDTAHCRQKELYDKRVHGKPYAVGEFVWLHNPHVPPGQSKKLYCPWSGPYIVTSRLSDVTYRIRNVYRNSMEQVVHFDRLKPCPVDVRLESNSPQSTDSQTSQHHFGENVELTMADEVVTQPTVTAPRYPTRTRRAPDRLGT